MQKIVVIAFAIWLLAAERASAGQCIIVIEFSEETTAHRAPCARNMSFSISSEKISVLVKLRQNGASVSMRPRTFVFHGGSSSAPFPIFSGPVELPIYDTSREGFVDGALNTAVGTIKLNYKETDNGR